MLLMRTLFLLSAILIAHSCPASVNDEELDTHARKAPKPPGASMEEVIRFLKTKDSGERNMARMIFTWMTHHITYDDAAFNEQKYPDHQPASVWKRRKAVCEGFASLFEAMCSSAGIECKTISGYSKGYGYKPGQSWRSTDHSWNAFKAEGRWRLVDVTWGAGSGERVNGKLISRKEFTAFWFDTSPEAFVLCHLPEDESMQLLKSPVTMTEYVQMPFVFHTLPASGIDAGLLLEALRTGEISEPITVYPTTNPPTISECPLNALIPANQTCRFRISGKDIYRIGIYEGKDLKMIAPVNGIWDFEVTPTHQFLDIILVRNPSATITSTLMRYKVSSR